MEKQVDPERNKYILEKLYTRYGIPVTVWDSKLCMVLQIGNDEKSPLYTDKEFINSLRKNRRGMISPMLEIEEDIFIYGLFLDQTDFFYMYGPIAIENPTIAQLYEYRKRHNIADKKFTLLYKPLSDLTNLLSMAYLMCTGELVEEKSIFSGYKVVEEVLVGEKEVNQYQFEKSEYDTEHLSYAYEQKYLWAIENGDVDFLKGTLREEPKALEKVGILAKDSKRQIEYMCVSSTVLVSRAAIRGGMNPSEAYSISELYMQKLEHCKDVGQIFKIHQTMQQDFVKRVRAQKQKTRNEGYIEICKDYIAQKVHYPIRIKEIADMLGMNHSYLTRKFREKEGMTIIQYMINAKLQAAANMLKYSEASLSQITDYFCFVSQSRFSTQFKQQYGVTPMVYRKENQVIDFSSKYKIVKNTTK